MKIEILKAAFIPFTITVESQEELDALYEAISMEYDNAPSGSVYEKILEEFMELIRSRMR